VQATMQVTRQPSGRTFAGPAENAVWRQETPSQNPAM
jgi:hypothetical protein